MKRFPLALLLILLIVSSPRAEQVMIRHVSELTERAELIARVKIICVIETGATEGFTKIAYARVSDSIKGLKVGSVFELDNDEFNVDCPNVRYVEGEDVLVFAAKLCNGHYETVYQGSGKFLIDSEAVDKPPFQARQSYSSARAEIRRELRNMPDAKSVASGFRKQAS